jgi:WD40 repeat protein
MIAFGEYVICVHDLTTGKNLSFFRTHFDELETCRSVCLAFSPDGKRLAAVYQKGFKGDTDFIVIWDITNEKELRNPRTLLTRKARDGDLPNAVYHIGFSPDGKTVVSGSRDGTIYLWEAYTGQERLHFKGGVTADFAPDGRILVCLSHDGMISHRQAANGDAIMERKELRRKDFIHVERASYSFDGKKLAMCDGYTLCLKEVETGATINRLDFQGYSIDSLTFSPDSKVLAVRTESIIRFVDAITGKEQCSWKSSDEGGRSLAFSADGKLLAWDENGQVRMEDVARMLNGGQKSRGGLPKTEPEDVPLRAEIIANRDVFECNLTGHSPEQFSELMVSGKVPWESPASFLFKLRNSGDQRVTLYDPDQELSSLYLLGPGAINLPLVSVPILRVFGIPKDAGAPKIVTLAPGETYSFPITITKSTGDYVKYYRSWLLPGEYIIRGKYSCAIGSSADRVPNTRELFDFVTIWSSPLRIKVVKSHE